MKIGLDSTVKFSDNFTKNRFQLRAFMRDIHPDSELREANILLNVYEAGIAKMLYQVDKISSTQYSSFINKLEYDYGMTTESAIEALNAWIDVCIKKDAGTMYGNRILDAKKSIQAPASSAPPTKISLGANETIFEDENVKVKFVRWERTHYLAGGNGRTGYFVFENKSNDRLCIYMKDISIDGFINLAESQPTSLDGRKKEMKGMPFIYENKVPGVLNDFETVEFVVSYGGIRAGLNTVSLIKGQKTESEIISVKL